MIRQLASRASALLFAGVLAVAPLAGAVAFAPAAAADSVTFTNTDGQIWVADPTVNPEDLDVDHGIIENPDGEDIMPLDAGLELPAGDDTGGEEIEGIPVEDEVGHDVGGQLIDPPAELGTGGGFGIWHLIGTLLGGLILGGLIAHFLHRRRYVQYETRV